MGRRVCGEAGPPRVGLHMGAGQGHSVWGAAHKPGALRRMYEACVDGAWRSCTGPPMHQLDTYQHADAHQHADTPTPILPHTDTYTHTPLRRPTHAPRDPHK